MTSMKTRYFEFTLNSVLAVAAIVLSCLFVACDDSSPSNPVTIPDTPVNLGEINSPFDDYNSASAVVGETFPLCFSSNRNSAGSNFDIVYKLIDVIASRDNGTLTVSENKNLGEFT